MPISDKENASQNKIQEKEYNLEEILKLINSKDAGDKKNGAIFLSNLAQKNHPKAQFQLGYLYEQGTFLKKNYITAAHWYETSAINNLPEACQKMSQLYKEGKGRPKDQQLAKFWSIRAEKFSGQVNNVKPKNNAATTEPEKSPKTTAQKTTVERKKPVLSKTDVKALYEKGISAVTLHDTNEALFYFDLLVDSDFPPAYYYAALMRFSQDKFQDAYELLKVGAEKGVSDAMYALGRWYQGVYGAEIEPEKAIKWLTEAADKDFYPAKVALLHSYAIGVGGIESSMPDAIKYFKEMSSEKNEALVKRPGYFYETKLLESPADMEALKKKLSKLSFEKAASVGGKLLKSFLSGK